MDGESMSLVYAPVGVMNAPELDSWQLINLASLAAMLLPRVMTT
jgi:hypothetical protein